MGMENYNPPQEPWLVILYQDDHIMVVNKPSGLLSVPGRLEEHKDSVMTRIQRDYPQAESEQEYGVEPLAAVRGICGSGARICREEIVTTLITAKERNIFKWIKKQF